MAAKGETSVTTVTQFTDQVIRNVETVIVGKRPQIKLLMVALLCQGHVLIEDVPGTGKTMLARAIAASMGISFKRLQCTPDLLPNDITGVSVFNQLTHAFDFRPGPVFAHILLTDEINRATPRTQAALLEAMQERQVTADGITRPLPAPFLVLATQNPIEYEGTYPLPEAQKDRFMLKIRMLCPDRHEELDLAHRMLGNESPEQMLEKGAVRCVLSAENLVRMRDSLERVLVRDELVHYLVDVVRLTRAHSSVLVGAGPRATQALLLSARAYAALAGRDFVSPDDIKTMAFPVLEHRLILRPELEIEGLSVHEVIQDVLENVTVPR